MGSDTIEFSKFEKELVMCERPQSPLDLLAHEIGKVYVVTITREACSACERQKPKLNALKATVEKKHKGKVVFTRIQVAYSPDKNEESLRSKNILGHYFYPTNLILLRTRDRGAFELYRNVQAEMAELERNITAALEVAAVPQNETT